jgi:hypothetical protein
MSPRLKVSQTPYDIRKVIRMLNLSFFRDESANRSATQFFVSVCQRSAASFLASVPITDHAGAWKYKSEQKHSYLKVAVSVSRRLGSILMTFLLLSVSPDAANVQLERVVGVLVESCTASEKNPPVRAANSSLILVDEWERGAAPRRRPQPRRE